MKRLICIQLVLLLAVVLSCHLAYSQNWDGQLPVVSERLKTISEKFDTYETVLKPDKDEAEYWAGAPSVIRDHGIFWMAARMRSPEHPRGLRGFEISIFKSSDGIHFEKVHEIRRESVPME